MKERQPLYKVLLSWKIAWVKMHFMATKTLMTDNYDWQLFEIERCTENSALARKSPSLVHFSPHAANMEVTVWEEEWHSHGSSARNSRVNESHCLCWYWRRHVRKDWWNVTAQSTWEIYTPMLPNTLMMCSTLKNHGP